jgi:outer membrane lipoprotein-sorting protein
MKAMLMISGILFSWISFGQTADEIVNQYLENTGGIENWKKVESTKISANVNAQGMKIPVEIWNFADGKSHTSFNLQGKKMVQLAFDGKKGYEMNFMTQKMEELDNERIENLKRSIGDYPSPFIGYKEKGYTLEKLDDETIEGTECFKLKFTSGKNLVEGKEVDDVSYYYFDKENFVPIVIETTMNGGPMAGKTAQSIMSDYDEVDGLYFPFSMQEKLKDGEGMGQTITFDKIEVNPKLDKTLFDFSDLK